MSRRYVVLTDTWADNHAGWRVLSSHWFASRAKHRARVEHFRGQFTTWTRIGRHRAEP